MERCERYTVLLSARLDGELTLEEKGELEAHLAQCPDCRALESQLAAIHSAFPQVEEVSPPEDFAGGVMDRVRAWKKTRSQAIPLFRRPRFQALAGLAACLALCLGAYQAGLPGRDRPEAAATAAPGGQTAQAGQDAPGPAAAAPAERGAAEPDGGEQPAPQARSAERQLRKETEEKSPDDGEESYYGLAEERPGEGETAAAPEASQDRASAFEPAESPCYDFENDQYIRVCYGQTPQAPAARILGSGDSLTAFLAQFPGDDLSQVSAAYGDAFFETGRLLAVVVEEGSGSVRHALAGQGLERDRVTVLRQVPEEGAADMAAWLILAEVDSSFQDGDTLTVVFQDR